MTTVNTMITSGEFDRDLLDFYGKISYFSNDPDIPYGTVRDTLSDDAYEPTNVQLANYRYVKTTYQALFDCDLLMRHNGAVVVTLETEIDANNEQFLKFLADLRGLQNYPLFSDDILSEIEHELEVEAVKSEVERFDDALDLCPDIAYALIASVTGETFDAVYSRLHPTYYDRVNRMERDTAIDRWESYLEKHMWDIIRQEKYEWSDKHDYIDGAKLAQLSPLYKLGQKYVNALYTVQFGFEERKLLGFPIDDNFLHDLRFDVEIALSDH